MPEYKAFIEEYRQLCLKYKIYIDNPIENGRLLLDYVEDGDPELPYIIEKNIDNILN